MVDSTPTETGPPSTIKSMRPSRSLATWAAVVGETWPERLADGATIGRPSSRKISRATGWAGDARAVLADVSSASGPRELWRGTVEGIAVSYARVFEQLIEVSPGITRVIASGGVTGAFPSFMNPVAQALGFPVQVVDVKRLTMRGAAALALSVLQAEHPLATIPETNLTEPDAAQRPYYDDLRARFSELYDAVIAG